MIRYVNLAEQWRIERAELMPLIEESLASGQYIGGPAVAAFEKSSAKICDAKHCIALNSGTDALVLGLHAMGVRRGDEVITPPNSFIASTAAIAHLGAIPVFVDVLDDQNLDPQLIEKAISSKTKAIMPVHLTGRMAKMDQIVKIAEKHNLAIIEDAAQAIGSRYKNIPSGKWGKVGCFSTHPLKNLNACGDGGFLVTDDDEIAYQVRQMANHGMEDRNTVAYFGNVSRMDALQATILNFRISRLNKITEVRRRNAELYTKLLDRTKVFIAEEHSNEFNTYHTFVIQVSHRDLLRKKLLELGIETAIHYPVPIHLQPAANRLGYRAGSFPVTELQANRIMTLPVHQYLSVDDINEIAEQVNRLSSILSD